MKKLFKYVGYLAVTAIFVGIFYFLIISSYGLHQALESSDWEYTKAEVVRTKISKQVMTSGLRASYFKNFYIPSITYSYSVPETNQKYTNSRISFFPQKFKFDSEYQAQNYIDSLINNNKVKIYFDPENPAISTIETGGVDSWGYLFLFVTLFFIAIGVVIRIFKNY